MLYSGLVWALLKIGICPTQDWHFLYTRLACATVILKIGMCSIKDWCVLYSRLACALLQDWHVLYFKIDMCSISRLACAENISNYAS